MQVERKKFPYSDLNVAPAEWQQLPQLNAYIAFATQISQIFVQKWHTEKEEEHNVLWISGIIEKLRHRRWNPISALYAFEQ